MRRTIGHWGYTNQDELTKQIDRIEKAERKAREEEFSNAKLNVWAENAKEAEIQKDIAYATSQDSSQKRQEVLIRDAKKIKSLEDKYISKWEAENRKTIAGLRQLEEDLELKTKLEKERDHLQQQIAKLRQG